MDWDSSDHDSKYSQRINGWKYTSSDDSRGPTKALEGILFKSTKIH